jgi:arylsulfatase A-like enzyme
MYGKNIAVMFPNASNGIPHEELTLAEALKTQGYTTGIIGKWHLGDAQDYYPTRHGFDYWYGMPYSNDMDWVDEPTFVELMSIIAEEGPQALSSIFSRRLTKYFDPKIDYWNVPTIRSQVLNSGFEDIIIERPSNQHQGTKKYTTEALAFIERNKNNPFFLYVPYAMPHTPLFRSQEFADRSLGGIYGDVIEELDWSVGAITKKLEELGLAEDTLVVFTSDNGPWLLMDQHGGSAGLLQNGKGTTFEGGMRVPTIFAWPGHIQPGVVSGIGSAMDIFSTVLNLAGAELPEALDGIDLSKTLLDNETSPRESMLYYRSGELYAYRKGPYKLHLITQGAYQMPPSRTEHESPLLFNLQTDPGERFNIAEKNPEIVAEMLLEIEAHRISITQREGIFDQQFSHLIPDQNEG